MWQKSACIFTVGPGFTFLFLLFWLLCVCLCFVLCVRVRMFWLSSLLSWLSCAFSRVVSCASCVSLYCVLLVCFLCVCACMFVFVLFFCLASPPGAPVSSVHRAYNAGWHVQDQVTVIVDLIGRQTGKSSDRPLEGNRADPRKNAYGTS